MATVLSSGSRGGGGAGTRPPPPVPAQKKKKEETRKKKSGQKKKSTTVLYFFFLLCQLLIWLSIPSHTSRAVKLSKPSKRKDCLRATDHVPTGSVTQRSITLAYKFYNGLHFPHSHTNTATSRKAEHEQRESQIDDVQRATESRRGCQAYAVAFRLAVCEFLTV